MGHDCHDRWQSSDSREVAKNISKLEAETQTHLFLEKTSTSISTKYIAQAEIECDNVEFFKSCNN